MPVPGFPFVYPLSGFMASGLAANWAFFVSGLPQLGYSTSGINFYPGRNELAGFTYKPQNDNVGVSD